MSSLIIFRPSGKVEYQYNTKISPFNEFISSIVNESITTLDENLFTSTINQKRFYGYERDQIYTAIYFDSITTIDSETVKTSLASIYKIFKVKNSDPHLNLLIELQYKKLISSAPTQEKSVEKPIEKEVILETPSNQEKKGKKLRKWEGGQLIEHDSSQVLDYSSAQANEDNSTSHLSIDQSNFTKQDELILVNELEQILNEEELVDPATQVKKPNRFFSKITGYLGGSINVEDTNKKFYEQLISKNVAASTSKIIIDKINHKLTNKSSVTLSTYKQTLIDELTKILTPNVSTDLLYDIKRNLSNPRPYVISIVGVNGVGKSTNLAKLAYWFLQNNLNVLICACDTFRSGAVEQLKVHVNNLKKLNQSNIKIDLFEKGYGSGDHVVNTAKAAIEFGGQNNFDVILIDTAGRTHSNTRLMAPLKKFGDAANPNKIIMVGEALVGTDSVEQALNFNNAFGNKRSLDFFIISKVDTVGDLVGTMINMVMATNVPILFLGTGQTYSDIKRLSTKTVVDMLMS